ncbi:hypothetical protein P175DRAFT_0509287 [Aspergillus ochraceoroseus IBT 24754]|uniref:Uncharacterized protein n=2 Tax=Aspergillus ochraceoroseus TaxID=138278 RepID=A0A2T5LWT0_9EURO|nr:uncharacterized protein P175DRAFT_0509287 [Aspergillus ochraceoroseus IBT 24754]KKK24979.1 hypothetical protein AOCH_003594 [Aspergillus ochraceoroseus]PTU20748.1 hypothetical protein P175DRAFT_0509287 [Aspergillus ochraceoroseus IBT 24754]
MMRPRDPRVRQTINQISHNLESANETAQEGIYTFSHNYIFPCFTAIGNCIYACTEPCLPSREDHLRRRRQRYAEFDFYDDWENEEADDTILGWGTDELDRLLAGSGLARGSAEQPRQQRKMSYGTRRTSRRKSGLLVPDDRNDPTVIPSSSFLGFLERFPWRLGARGLKYRPSAADLQEHPTGLRRHVYEESPLMEAAEESDSRVANSRNARYRSSTQSSRETTNSLSSRGDLIPSDEEEDAVPLDDEFAMILTSRRGTGLESDDQGGDKPESMRSTSGTFSLASSKASKRKRKKQKMRASRMRSPQSSYADVSHDATPISIEDLKREEEQIEQEEESEVARRRLAAQQLALSRGISLGNIRTASLPRSSTASSDLAHRASSANMRPLESGGEHDLTDGRSRISRRESNSHLDEEDSRTEPFPPFPMTPSLPSPEVNSMHDDPTGHSAQLRKTKDDSSNHAPEDDGTA